MFNKLRSRRAKSQVKQKIKLNNKKTEVPDNMFRKCAGCNETIHWQEAINNEYKCPQCNYHFKMKSSERIKLIFDRFEEFDYTNDISDPLSFPGYPQKINEIQSEQGIKEAVVTGYASIDGTNVIGIIMDSYFLMGSMGVVVGEKITKAFEKAIALDYPVILFSASGGARMQEGLYSLLQMAKTSAIVERFNQKGGLYINVITNPTTGGVSASFVMLADIILAEPQALIGFAGPRVIKQTIKQDLPKDFQSAEFVMEKGFIDKVVDRSDLKMMLSNLLMIHK